MERQSRTLFLALILAQAAHSVEEYVFRLFDLLAPARFLSGLVSADLAFGFAVVNAALVLFGSWCYFARVRVDHRSGRGWAWFWAILEIGNGIGHLVLAVANSGYFPGAATAPLLLVSGAWLAVTLAREAHPRRGDGGPGTMNPSRPG